MLVLESSAARATIDPLAGGRLASLVVGGRELLVARGPAARPIAWGCYLMAPWPGRLEGGRFSWRGRTIQLPRTHGRNAIHGLVWDRPWEVVETGAEGAAPVAGPAAPVGGAAAPVGGAVTLADERVTLPDGRATLACALPPEWPMGGVVRQTFELTPHGLRMTASLTARDPMPAALGWHPWFARRGLPVAVRVHADAWLETMRMVPTGTRLSVTGERDLRAGGALGRRRLDHAYVAAAPPATIDWPDLRLTLSWTPAPSVVVVHTPASGVCIEPQTAPPNALALPEPDARAAGVRFLAAGETLTASLQLDWELPPSAPPAFAMPRSGRSRKIDR
jgi:aldose 1-epimerase